MELFLIASESEIGLRLDKFLFIKIPDLTREQAKRMILQGSVHKTFPLESNKQKLRPSDKVSESEIYHLSLSLVDEIVASDSNPSVLLQSMIAFEDEDILIINKPAGILSQKKPGNGELAIPDMIRTYLGPKQPSIGDPDREFLIHRLDRETSGLLVAAKNSETYDHLGALMKNREIEKKYIGVIWGMPSSPRGQIKNYVIRHKTNRAKMAIVDFSDDPAARLAITDFKLIAPCFEGLASIMEWKLVTGRTHQIRLHMKHINRPIVGDKLYGVDKQYFHRLSPGLQDKLHGLDRHFLHASSIKFQKLDGSEIYLKIPLPSVMSEIILAKI